MIEANESAVFTTLRTRLSCDVWEGDAHAATHQAFNEACLDRGLGLNFLQMDCYIDGSYVTTIQVRACGLWTGLQAGARRSWCVACC